MIRKDCIGKTICIKLFKERMLSCFLEKEIVGLFALLKTLSESDRLFKHHAAAIKAKECWLKTMDAIRFAQRV